MGVADRACLRFADLIRSRRDEIVRRWEAAVRALAHAGSLDEPRLIDNIPELLDRIAVMTEELGHGDKPELPAATAERHAIARLEEGFDIDEVLAELAVLRDVLLAVLDDQGGQVSLAELRVVNGAIDRAVRDSVNRYAEVRDRTLQGFDRIGAAALESRSLDDLLRRLLQVLHETTPSIDMSSIYLLDGGVPRRRAVVGMNHEAEAGLTGFAGTIARNGTPLTVHREPQGPMFAGSDLRVLSGIPIRQGEITIGVAVIGSLRVAEFSQQDQRIFAAMVSRASAAIVQHVLGERAQHTSRQLAQRERELRALADNIPQLTWMADTSGFVYWFNRRWYEYTGLAPQDSEGGAWKAKVHHPEHFERVERLWAHAIAAGTAWEDIFPLRGKDGYYRWFLSRAVPIRDSAGNIERWFGTNTDVTARRFLDDATRVLNDSLEYRATLERLAQLVVPDLADWCIVDLVEDERLEHVAIVHRDQRKLELAREYARTHPPSGDSDVGTRDVLRTGRAQIAAEITEDMISTRGTSPDDHVYRELGFRSWIGAPLAARGETIGIIHLIMSDSNRRYSPADLDVASELGHRAGSAVDNARLYNKAQAAVRVRDDVLAIVSHDLRNPLNAIDLAATVLLQQFGSDVRGRKHLETIRRAKGRMEHLIDDLLDMASINAGKFSLQLVHVDAHELIDEVIDIHEPIANERGVTIMREADTRGVSLYVDRNRILQAFANLMSNAIKFCSPGDVIMVRSARDGERARFVVADTGPGIPRSELGHIFEPYWSGRGGKKQGTGLGLFITKGIIEAHGGTLEARSEEGHGATFTVELPIARA